MVHRIESPEKPVKYSSTTLPLNSASDTLVRTIMARKYTVRLMRIAGP